MAQSTRCCQSEGSALYDTQARLNVVKEVKIMSEQKDSVVAVWDRIDRDGVRWELCCPEQKMDMTLKLFITILHKCIQGGVTVTSSLGPCACSGYKAEPSD